MIGAFWQSRKNAQLPYANPSGLRNTSLLIGYRIISAPAGPVKPTIIGFACHDATALGFFGPIGVEKSHRKQGTGKALMTACLLDMRLKGYGYAIVGAVEDTEYYKKTVGALEIPDSSPGIYKTWVRDIKTKRPK
jgi:GNAT superfamily N-acetyltransferase